MHRRGASRSARPAAAGISPLRHQQLLPVPHSPTVVPAFAGTQGRGAARGRLRLSSLPHSPMRHSCEGRNPEGRRVGRPHHQPPPSIPPRRTRSANSFALSLSKGPPPPPATLASPQPPPSYRRKPVPRGARRGGIPSPLITQGHPQTQPRASEQKGQCPPAPASKRGNAPPRQRAKGATPPLTPQTAAPPARRPPRQPERSGCSPGL